MGLREDIMAYKPNTLAGTNYSFLDGDTLENPDGPNYRIEGYNSAEVSKYLGDKGFSEGTAGGQTTTDIITNLANEQGFTNVKPLFNPDGSPKLAVGSNRQMVQLTNANGESFTTRLLESGAMDLTDFSSKEDKVRVLQAQRERNESILKGTYTSNAFDKASNQIKNAELSEGAKSRGFRDALSNEAERMKYIDYFMNSKGMSRKQAESEMDKYFTRSVDESNYGVSLNNKSLNPISDSWSKGWMSVGESGYGIANMAGARTGIEGLESWGEAGVKRQNLKMQEFGYTIDNYKSIEGVASTFEYLGNVMAMSLPYMAATAAAAITAAPTGGLSFSLPMGLYAGMTWNEMEGDNDSKSASLAIGAGVVMSVLDRLGLKGLGGFRKNPAKAIAEDIPKEYALRNDVTIKEAKEIISEMANQSVGAFAKEAESIAKKQLTAGASAKRLLGGVGVGSSVEGFTEVGQEAVGYAAAVAGSEKEFDMEEFQDRLANAAIAGTALGSTFSIPGSINNQIGWMDAAARFGEPISDSETEKFKVQEIEKYGTVRSIGQVLSNVRASIANRKRERSSLSRKAYDAMLVGTGIPIPDDGVTPLAQLAEEHIKNEGNKPFSERGINKLMNISALWQGSTTDATKETNKISAASRALSSMLGGMLTPLHGGAGLEAAQHHKVTEYKNLVPLPAKAYKMLGLKSFLGLHSTKNKAEISKRVYDTLQAAVDPTTGRFNSDLIPEGTKNKVEISIIGNKLIELGEKMRNDQLNAGADMGDVTNYLHRFKSLDKGAVQANQAQFKEALLKEFNNLDSAEAQSIIDNIIDNPEVNSLDEAMQSNVGSLNPSSHRKRTMNLSELKAFDDFYNKDIFANVANAAKSAARYVTQMEYVGKDGEIVSELLNQMLEEGVSREEVAKVAFKVRNILEAVSGNYNRPKTDAGKKLMRFQKSAMFWMTLSALPLATFSSLPELAMTQGALTNEQIFGDNGSIKSMVREFVGKFVPQLEKVEESIEDDLMQVNPRTEGERVMRELGYYQWDVGAATVAGVSEVNDNRRTAMEAFFRITGLTAWTDYTRAIRGSMAFDFIAINSRILGETKYAESTLFDPETGEVIERESNSGTQRNTQFTREAQEAEQKLRALGIPVEQFIAIQYKVENARGGVNSLTAEENALWEQSIKEATFNFINQTVPIPGAANRPLLYQDPRYALFTQFQGFISTFTANQLPRMWNDYLKRGTPQMKYNTFVLMSTMIALGFFSQAMKDLIKFDDDDDNEGTLGNPYLDTPEYIRRGVFASGLAGTGERLIDMVAPIYGQRSNGMGDWLYNQATGESPTLGYVGRLGDAAMNLAGGDVERAVYQGLKSAPLIGPLTDTNKRVASTLTGGGWNYKEND